VTAAVRIPPGASAPTAQATQLILEPDVRQVFTDHCSTDAKTAVSKGIKEFLSQLEAVTPGGRTLRFLKTYDTWADAEDSAEFPSAIVDVSAEGTYDPASFTPALSDGAPTVLGANVYLLSTVELVQPVSITIWHDDPTGRMKLMAMLEDAFAPVDWRYGVRLMLPHYHGVHMNVSPRGAAYADDTMTALRRHRNATMRLDAVLPVLRVTTKPSARPKFVLKTLSEDAALR